MKSSKNWKLIISWREMLKRVNGVHNKIKAVLPLRPPPKMMKLLKKTLRCIVLLERRQLQFTMTFSMIFSLQRGIKLIAEGREQTSAQLSSVKSSRMSGQSEMPKWTAKSKKSLSNAPKWMLYSWKSVIKSAESSCLRPKNTRRSKWRTNKSSKTPTRRSNGMSMSKIYIESSKLTKVKIKVY